VSRIVTLTSGEKSRHTPFDGRPNTRTTCCVFVHTPSGHFAGLNPEAGESQLARLFTGMGDKPSHLGEKAAITPMLPVASAGNIPGTTPVVPASA